MVTTYTRAVVRMLYSAVEAKVSNGPKADAVPDAIAIETAACIQNDRWAQSDLVSSPSWVEHLAGGGMQRMMDTMLRVVSKELR